MNFTFNNHLKYTIGGRPFGYRETSYENFIVSVGSVDKEYYKTSNWLKEQYRTAAIVRNDLGKELVVFFSGGTDSEIVLRSFVSIGIRPRSVFIKFSGGFNEDDLKYAIAVTDELGITLEIIEFDVLEFYLSGEASEIAKSLNCSQIAYLTVYYNILKLQAPAVMGGEMLLKKHLDVDLSKWYYCIRENEDASAMRFSIKYNIPLVNEWFSYTPEMMGYYLEDIDVHQLIGNDINYKFTSVSSKNKILKKLFPNIREKNKTHGYEKLMGFNVESYRRLYDNYIKRLSFNLDGIFIDELKIQLFGENYENN
jgi:hypothetical protein